MPVCWICRNAEATTREHEVQASSVKRLMPDMSLENPVLVRRWDSGGKNLKSKRIFSPSAEFLKPLTPDLCAACNSSLTQPHDACWAALLARLTSLKDPRHDLQAPIAEWFPPFPDAARAMLLGVHLHWAKKLGCYIAQSGVPRDLTELGDCILAGRSVPNLHIAFGVFTAHWSETDGGRTPINYFPVEDRAAIIRALYYFGNISVLVLYFEAGYVSKLPANSWHPDWPTRALTLRYADLRKSIDSRLAP